MWMRFLRGAESADALRELARPFDDLRCWALCRASLGWMTEGAGCGCSCGCPLPRAHQLPSKGLFHPHTNSSGEAAHTIQHSGTAACQTCAH